MKDLLPDDRPREKLRQHGVAALGDNELVALVIGNGSRRGGALSVANALLAAHGGLHGLTRCTADDFVRIVGIGFARASQIVAALELGRRTLTHSPSERIQILGPREAAAYLMPRFGARDVEQFGIVLLDSKHRVLRTAVLAIGTPNSAIVQPREVFREAAAGGRGSAHRHRCDRSRDSGRLAILQLQGNGAAVSRVLYFDCFSGISGDMALGAMLDAGLPLEELTRALGSLAVS